jgi:glycosyltransferase involved in cell wall biosynthesis
MDATTAKGMTDRKLRALHVIPSLSPKHGGPSYAIRAIARALSKVDVEITIATTDDDGDDARLNVPIGKPVDENSVTVFYFRRNILPYKVAFGLGRWLRSNIARYDLVHVHALFSFSSAAAGHTAYWEGVPYVVRPLGVLNKYGLVERRPVLKKISMPLVENRILRHAAAIHYTSEAERQEASEISTEIANHRSVVIPLPIEYQKGNANDFRDRFPQLVGRRVVLFLSRIDAKKGIELLLDAFTELSRNLNEIILVVAGNGPPIYLQTLQNRAQQLRVADRVVWTGHLEGADKAGAFAAAEVFVLPSYSENFGIAAAEALAYGVPTIVTDQVAISDDIRSNDAGLVVGTETSEIAAAIRSVFNNRQLAARLSHNGRQLATESYSLSSIGHKLHSLYYSIVAGSPRSA